MSTFKDMDALLQGFVDRGLPGCGCAIAQNGKTIYENYFGYGDIENKIPVTEKSVFRQFSLTKIPMYTTCMILYEKGKYLLTTPIYEFFPEWKDAKKAVPMPNGEVKIVPVDNPVTVGDVLRMTCGLPYSFFRTANITQVEMAKLAAEMRAKGPFSLREEIKEMVRVPLAFEPGTQWMYGYASDLAAGVIEAVTGKSCADAMKEYLFDPLGMNDTYVHFFGDIQQRLVKMYRKAADGVVGPPANSKEFLPGRENEAGWPRLFSTVQDYIKLTQALALGGELNGVQVIGRKTIDLLRTNTLNDDMLKSFTNSYLAGYGYGYGLRTVIDKAAGQHNGSIGAFGWTGGSGTWAEIDPSEGVSIVYMHNQSPNDEEYHHLRVRAVAYGCID